MESPVIREQALRDHFIKEGVNESDPALVKKFLRSNQIEDRLGRVRDYANGIEDQWRREFLQNTVGALEVILNLRKNAVGLADPVSDEQAYRTVFWKRTRINGF